MRLVLFPDPIRLDGVVVVESRWVARQSWVSQCASLEIIEREKIPTRLEVRCPVGDCGALPLDQNCRRQISVGTGLQVHLPGTGMLIVACPLSLEGGYFHDKGSLLVPLTLVLPKLVDNSLPNLPRGLPILRPPICSLAIASFLRRINLLPIAGCLS